MFPTKKKKKMSEKYNWWEQRVYLLQHTLLKLFIFKRNISTAYLYSIIKIRYILLYLLLFYYVIITTTLLSNIHNQNCLCYLSEQMN